MNGLVALAVVVGLTTGAVGKGSFVKITTRSGKVVLGVVVDEMPTGFGIQNGNQREIIGYADIADMTELSVAQEAPPPPPPTPPPAAPVAAPPPPREREVYEEPEPPPPPDPPSSIAIRTNLADIGFFGPTLGAEVELVGKLGVLLEARSLLGGVMNALGGPYGPANFGTVYGSYALRLEAGGGGTAGIIYFLGSRKGLRGFYLSAALEVLYRSSRLSGQSGGYWNPASIGQWFLTPHARIGWRWRAGPVLIGLGARGGAGVLAASNVTYTTTGMTSTWGASNRIYVDGSAIFELGFFVR